MAKIGDVPGIREIIEEYGLKAFVETGTWLGASVEQAVLWGFECIRSCDVNPEYVRMAREKFQVFIDFYEGRSHQVLPMMVEDLDKPTLFWLDAHLPLYHDATMVEEFDKFPLLEEFKAIKEFKPNVQRDVIVCDDVKTIITNNPHACTEQQVSRDQLVEFIDWDEVIGFFSDTHNWTVFPRVEFGVLILTPK